MKKPENQMRASERKSNMGQAAVELKRLLEPGLLGNFTWFEATEVIALSPSEKGSPAVVRNILSIYVAEPGERPAESENKYVSGKPQSLKTLDGWKFGVARKALTPAQVIECIERYGRDGKWLPDGKNALSVGELRASTATFCPSDSRTEVPLNAILKNNFWSGSYVLELKDDKKTELNAILSDDRVFEELSERIADLMPIDLERVADRTGEVVIQIPSSALIADFRHPPGSPIELQLAWNPDIPPRPVVGEYRVDHDGLISSLARFEYPVGRASLEIPPASGDLRFSVWDPDKGVVLAARAVLPAPDGRGYVESRMTSPHPEPRRFSAMGPDETVESQEVAVMQPEGGGWFHGVRPSTDWVGRRDLKARMKHLAVSKQFLQYGTGADGQFRERRRALQDLRVLMEERHQGGIYLWDPYLSANDVLNTLAFCSDSGAELRALTSSKSSKMDRVDDGAGDSEPEAASQRERWIRAQGDVLDGAFNSPTHLNLEFRMSWGLQGSFHDRFLIFPGFGRRRTQAWSLGASINHIGSEHCIVQQVAYPEPVLQAFLRFWNESSTSHHLIWKSK